MNCKECFIILDDYVENELDNQASLEVSLHLNDCSKCANNYERLKRERKIYMLHLSIAEIPPPAAWAKLQTAIELQQQRRFSFFNRLMEQFVGAYLFNHQYLVALLIVFIIMAGLITFLKFNYSESSPDIQTISQNGKILHPQSLPEKENSNIKRDTPNFVTKDVSVALNSNVKAARVVDFNNKNVPRPAVYKRTVSFEIIKPDNGKLAVYAAVVESEQQYLEAIELLSRDIKSQRKLLSPKTLALLRQSDRTISETRRAVAMLPRDPHAIQYMNIAYDKKLELLRTIASN
jgi:hypothetical protein